MITQRIPFHSEEQHLAAMDLLRSSEPALKGDALNEDNPAVVPPAPVLPEPINPMHAASAAAGAGIDYDKLAQAIVTAQARMAEDARVQQAQAAAATSAVNPGWVPPGAVTASPVVPVGAETAAADPNAQPT